MLMKVVKNVLDIMNSKRIRIDNEDLESSEDIDSFARHYEVLFKILPDVAKVLHSHSQLDILLLFSCLSLMKHSTLKICYLQFVNLINFLSSGNIHAMRYQANVKHL